MKKIYLLIFLIAQFASAQPGNLDISFDPYGVYMGGSPSENYGYIYDVAIQDDGKIIIVGMFHYCNGYPANNIARLNADGSFDTTFNTGSGTNILSGWSISTVAVQWDGKIIIGGIFTTYNGVAKKNIARLNSDGSLDAGFVNLGPTETDYGYTSVQKVFYNPDNGQIMITGSFTKFDTTTCKGIINLNPDGTINSRPNFSVNGGIASIDKQSDGKIILGGNFGQVNGVNSRALGRLNTNGTFDSSFALQYINQSVFNAVVLPDDKILVAGNFTAYGSTLIDGLMRLNANGSLDTSFSTSTTHGGSMKVQSDGKILIGRGGVIERYNPDGTPDTTFATGTLTAINNNQPAAYVFAIQPDDRIIVAGLFATYNGNARRSIARINGDTLGLDELKKNELSIYPNPVQSMLNLQLSNNVDIERITVTDIAGKIILDQAQNTTQLNVEDLAAGVYMVHAFSENGKSQSKFVKL